LSCKQYELANDRKHIYRDFGIVGNIFTVLPEVLAEVKRVLNSR
jgi:hypothetical protein